MEAPTSPRGQWLLSRRGGNREPASFSLPSWIWVMLPAISLWPIWYWSARRMTDGSDDPLGVLALLALMVLVLRARRELAHAPRVGWTVASLFLASAALYATTSLPILIAGVLAVAAMTCGVLAVRNDGHPVLPWLGLGLLALPVISSLQFFVGYPLRVVTAQVSSWILHGFGVVALREGSTLAINGQLIMVDAPCSGIQMAWVAYFTACLAAAWLRLRDGVFIKRIAGVGALVLAGNIVRNSLLVALEADQAAKPQWMHELVGILVFLCVCTAVLLLVIRGASKRDADVRVPDVGPAAADLRGTGVTDAVASAARHSTPSGRWTRAAMSFAAIGFITLALAPALISGQAEARTAIAQPEWPDRYDGTPIRPLALSEVEQRFAGQFPGAIARFTDERRVITLRHVTAPTRKLHPAADCYRGLGYRISQIALAQRAGSPRLQRCFVASKHGRRLRVCEFIEDAAGRSFTDTSAWYWAAVRGESRGPWLAVTTASTDIIEVASK